MNILFTTDTYTPNINGIVTSIENYRKSLINLNHKVYIAAPKFPCYKFPENVIPVRSVPFWGEKDYRISLPLKVLKRTKWSKLKLDIIHTHTIFNLGLFGYYLSKRLHIPIVHTYHTYYEKYVHYSHIPQFISKPLARLYSRYYLNKCGLIIAPSKKIADVLKSYGVKNKIVLLPTGIGDIKKYSDEEIREFKRRFQRTPKTKVLLYVGRIAQEKNVKLIIGAVSNLIDERADVVLLLVGDGHQKKQLQKFVKSIRKENHIIFTGYIPFEDIGLYYSIGDIFVFSSETETQGLVILEALSYGLPIVSVKDDSTCELLKNNVNGLLTENTEIDFFKKLRTLVYNENFLNKLKNSNNKKLEELSTFNQCNKLIDYYKEIIGEMKKNSNNKSSIKKMFLSGLEKDKT